MLWLWRIGSTSSEEEGGTRFKTSLYGPLVSRETSGDLMYAEWRFLFTQFTAPQPINLIPFSAVSTGVVLCLNEELFLDESLLLKPKMVLA